jgi:putative copper export protein
MDRSVMTTLRRRYSDWCASIDGRTRFVLLAFIVLAVQPLLVGELSVLFSPHKHATVVGTLVGFAILAAILVALLTALVRRRRWAWLVLVILFGLSLILDLFYFNGVVRFTLDVIVFALLVSPPMRRYVNGDSAPDRRHVLNDGTSAE